LNTPKTGRVQNLTVPTLLKMAFFEGWTKGQPKVAFAFTANGFEFPSEKVARFAGPLNWVRDRFFSSPDGICVHRKRLWVPE